MAMPPEMTVIMIPAVQKTTISNLLGGRMVGLASFTVSQRRLNEKVAGFARCRIGNADPMVRRMAALEKVAQVTSAVNTWNFVSVHGPKEVTIATSVASRPRAIRIRPMRGLLWRASNVYQRSPR
jgi:hypothetical protein